MTQLSERRVQLLAAWYGAAYFAFHGCKTIYATYTVQLFLHAFKLPLEWFYIGQVVLGIWNAVDDSLMAVVATLLHRGATPALKHVQAYWFGAPMIAGAFLVPFFPWSTKTPWLAGLHHVFSICLWDAAISYVAVSHSSLGTDISGELVVRARCKKYEIVALTGTALAVGTGSLFWDVADLSRFRTYVVGMAALSMLLMQAAARALTAELLAEQREMQDEDAGLAAAAITADCRQTGVGAAEDVASSEPPSDDTGLRRRGAAAAAAAADESKPGADEETREDATLWTLLKQTAMNHNFRIWIIMQFCVYCNTMFQTKFFTMFSTALFQGGWAQGKEGVMLSGAHVVRSVLSIWVVLPLVEKMGIYSVFRWGCWIQLSVSLVGLLAASSVPVLLPICFVFNLIFTSHKVVVGMFIADLTDEDYVQHRRHQPMSSFFFAIRSFFTVWADSIVPMFIVWLLVQGGMDPHEGIDSDDSASRSLVMTLWWMVPVVLASMQMLLMRFFTLHGDYLEQVKQGRARMMRADSNIAHLKTQ